MEHIAPFNKTGTHSYHRRAIAHNYKAPFIYHIILKKNDEMKPFGTVRGDTRIKPGNEGCAYIEESVLGKIIAKRIIRIQQEFPILQIYQFCVMPDHVHILLRVKDWSEKHLDFYVECLKHDIATQYSAATNTSIDKDDIFSAGYCDKPLLINRSLDGLFRYIRENPHRLAMRLQFPQFYQCVRNLEINDMNIDAYGNLFLLRNPDKEAVKFSRTDSPEEIERKAMHWSDAADTGTILVSPFISPKEKELRRAAENRGAKIILIRHEVFGERYKPSEHDFNLCAEGRLLILSMKKPAGSPLTREICLMMNNFAKTVADSY